MFKKILVGFSVAAMLALPVAAIAGVKKTAAAPTGAERTRQYWIMMPKCQKQFGPDSTPEYGSHYNRTGWWCINHVW